MFEVVISDSFFVIFDCKRSKAMFKTSFSMTSHHFRRFSHHFRSFCIFFYEITR